MDAAVRAAGANAQRRPARWKAPSAWRGRLGEGGLAEQLRRARASAWMPVAWAMPLIQGGLPPPNEKKYSQVMNEPRSTAISDISVSSLRMPSRSQGASKIPRQDEIIPLALPKLPSGWIWRPWPA